MSRRFAFRSVAILGANVQSMRIAVRFAMVGFRVFLYDRGLSSATVDGLLSRVVRFEPQIGFEVLSLIVACDFEGDLQGLGAHDLVVEAYDDVVEVKQAWLTRLAPYFSRTALVVSNCEGGSVARLAEALPAGMRPRFLGARFARISNMHRLVEVVAPLRCEERQVSRFCAFLRDDLGLKPYLVPDEGNFVLMRVAVFVLAVAFFHGKRLGLSLAQVEALSARILGREHGGVCLIVEQLGRETLSRAFARVDDCDREAFGVFFDFPKALEEGGFLYDFADSSLQFSHLSYHLPEDLSRLFSARDWLALSAREEAPAQFMVAFLRDVWQFLARVAHQLGVSGEFLDGLLYYGLDWRERPWRCLQDFQSCLVFESTRAISDELPYVVVDFWAKKGRRRKELVKASDAFMEDVLLLAKGEVGRLFLYKDALLVWQNYELLQEFSLPWLRELLAACERARVEHRMLLIDYRAQVQSFMRPWRLVALSQAEFGEFLSLFYRLLVELRMLAQPVLFSATGRVYDAVLAILMQCDVVVVDSDFSWQLSGFSDGLTGIGGVWFEWLRRLPQFSSVLSRQQLFSVLDFVLSHHGVYGAQYARRLQLLRGQDVFVANPLHRSLELKKVVDYFLVRGEGRAMRFPLLALDDKALDWHLRACVESVDALRYRRLVSLLAQKGDAFLSLRHFFKDERALFLEVLGDSN